MSYQSSFQAMQDALHAVRQNQLTIAAFCQTWRTQAAQLSGLPPRYREVMEDLLSRLEAGSLFTEESCSFSQTDLLTTLDMWLDNTRQALSTAD
ncbi:MAG TPA: hypothetical protein VL528_03305 [Oxalicibacterium sp.]|jgi:hypothetical protein|nr:hypothetical protein [Oxalicibacterium sp.]